MILQIWGRFLTNDVIFEFEEKVSVVDGTPASRTRRRLAHGWAGLGVFRPGSGRRRRRNRLLFPLCDGGHFQSCNGVRGATLVLLGVRSKHRGCQLCFRDFRLFLKRQESCALLKKELETVYSGIAYTGHSK